MTEQQPRPTEKPLRSLATAYLEAGQALHLAVLDDAAARLRALAPDADRLAVCLNDDGDLTIDSIWSAPAVEHDGRRTRIPAGVTTPDALLALTEIASDLEMVVPSLYLENWGVEHPRPCPRHDTCCWLTLPPADRMTTLTSLVRAHIHDAEALICAVERREERVLVGFDRILRTGGDPVDVPCPGCDPHAARPWPRHVSHQLVALLGQLYALPHLRSRHMTPCLDSASKHDAPLWQITLPWSEPRLVAAAAH